MFFSASIALALLSLSGIAVYSAPLNIRDTVQQACTGPNGSGTCTPLNGDACLNTPNLGSLILNRDADCGGYPLPDCNFINPDGTVASAVREIFSDTSQNVAGLGIQSVSCGNSPGTVNGFTAGSPEDISQEADDAAAGVLVPA
ncbi:hypothetical protein K438DRAFT_1997316 [Mycena galopus ATCC 62051]|nr:hypothetical protein K438DRAFT_1997316 [Mycena galopus ATCC 62051]